MPIILRNKTATIEIDINVSLQHIVTKGSFDVTMLGTGLSDSTPLVCLSFRKNAQIKDNINLDWREISEPAVASATELRDLILGWNVPPVIITDSVLPDGAATSDNQINGLQISGIKSIDSPSIDAFGRWRVSDLKTLFDSKQTGVAAQIYWDDVALSGAGTGSVYSENAAKTTISVTANTAGKHARQTKARLNYQPGKSQLILVTFNIYTCAAGIQKRVGYFDDQNGLFFELIDGVYGFVRRTYVTGSAVNNRVIQSSWNIDKMDGTGISGITLDFTKTQILFIDFEWLGVGRVRMGWVVNGLVYYAHQFLNTNVLAEVYMSKPNLPVRYEIENNGSGAASSMDCICCSVSSEGGQDSLGIARSKTTANAGLALSASAKTAIIGIRLKSTELDATITIESIAIMCRTINDSFRWEIILNPTVAGAAFTFSSNGANSAMEVALGDSTSLVSDGTLLLSGVGKDNATINYPVNAAYRLGAKIDGTADIIVLALYNYTNSLTIDASLNWRELL